MTTVTEAWTRWLFRRSRSVGFVMAVAVLAGLFATCDGDDGEIVGPPVPTTIAITPETLELAALGDTAVLVARVLDQNGGFVSGAAVSWSSGDESVATVSGTGVVTAVGNGGTAVTARSGGLSGQARVVVEQRVVSLVVGPDSLILDAAGDTASLAAEARDSNGAVVSGAAVSWSSGDESVATVSSVGVVTAVGRGSTAVTASADGAAAQARVVVEQRVAALAVVPDSLRFDALGDTATLVAEVLDSNGAVVSLAVVSWSSADESVVAVSAAGVVTSAGNGMAAVTASSEGAEAEASVVVQQKVASVVVTPDSLVFDALGDTATLVAEARDSNGSLVAGAVVSWASTDETIATISSTGLVTSAGNGAAAVTASADGTEGQARVVVEQRVASVIVTPASLRLVALGDTASLAAEARDSNGSVVSGAAVSWASANQSIAAISSTGLVTAVGNGTATVTASADGAEGQARVVVQQRVASLVVAPDSLILDAAGDTATLVAEARDSNGAVISGAAVSWSSGNGSVAAVSSAGVVTAVGRGATAVTASADGARGQAQVVVEQRVASLVVAPDSLRFDALGDTTRLVAEARDASGAIVFGDAVVSWSSGDQSVATVSGGGLVTSAGNGTATVTASADGTESQALVVVEQRIASVVVTPASLTLDAAGDTARLFADARDPNGAVVSGAAVSWTSGDESVVTVNGAGLVTAVGAGNAVVTARAGESEDQARVAVGQRVASVVVTPSSLTFDAAGDTASLVAEARDSNGAAVSGVVVSWTSGNDSVATVSSTGLVTAAGEGATSVTASAEGHQGSASVAVRAPLHPDRVALEALYNSTSGSTWANKTNWRSDAPLDDWYGVNTDADGRVSSLRLGLNGLRGAIPSELGDLSSLTVLDLNGNGLTGSIPSELGDLSKLDSLYLHGNGLTGSGLTGAIPPELGNLSKLSRLNLSFNGLSGALPSELGDLASLEWMSLSNNSLSGSIPGEVGDLASLEWMSLSNNSFSGSIPGELGSLSSLESLYLSGNALSGTIPPELGSLSALRRLDLSANGLAGTIPNEMTSLANLESITVDSAVCAPRTAAFAAWLSNIAHYNVTYCTRDDHAAYVMQVVPATNYAVPILAGETGLLRVFVTAHNPDSVGMPPVRATFYSGGTTVHTAEIPARPNTPIPDSVDEGDFGKSANAEIPGSVLTAGVEMVVEIDPDGTLGSSVDVAGRIPETGRISLDVQSVDVVDLTVIPFLLESDPDSTLLALTDSLGPDHELFGMTRTVLPVIDMEVTVHDPVWTSSKEVNHLLNLVTATRVAEGGSGYWMGLLKQPEGANGLAITSGQDSFADPVEWFVAHELGHNFSLLHAPCGGAGGADRAYPYTHGLIGVWGWEPGTTTLVSPSTPDVMGYCGSGWISDYHYSKAFNHRATTSPPPNFAARAADEQTLLLWGGARADGSVYLNPAFVVDAPPMLPEAGGVYRVVGEAEDGSVLFSRDFAMQEVADGDGGYSFAFALPVDPAWAAILARITLTGGGGSATLGREGDEAAVLLRDPDTGQVRGLLLDVPVDSAAQAEWLTPLRTENMDVQISRGIPAVGAWQR